MIKEEKICSYTKKGKRIQLLKIWNYLLDDPKKYITGKQAYYFQIRINRKIIQNFTFESQANKKMCSILTEDLLQQKFNF